MEHIFRRKSAVFTASSVYLQRCSYDGNRVMLRASLSSSSSPSSVSGGKGEKRSKSSRLVLYSQLAKFRLSSLVVMTSGAGYACYGAAIDPITFSACTIGTALCAGSANAFNQVGFCFSAVLFLFLSLVFMSTLIHTNVYMFSLLTFGHLS